MSDQEYLDELSRQLLTTCGLVIQNVTRLTGGTNNQIYRLELTDGTKLIAKRYFEDPRERLRREFDLLSVLKDQGFTEVPQPIARFDEQRTAIYGFLEGEHRSAANFTEQELEAIADYLAKLHQVSKDKVSKELLPGFSSALSLGQVIERIQERIVGVLNVDATLLHQRVRTLLQETQVIELVRKSVVTIQRLFGSERLANTLPDEYQRLSSVDFGPHNMLWTLDGRLQVLDFEYGGWDHPLRVIGDSLAHDQTRALSESQKSFFMQRYLEKTSLPKEVLADIYAFCLISQIEWVMVLVTSLLPERVAKFQHAKGPDYDIEKFLEEQGEKIRARLPALERVVDAAKLVP